MLSVSGQRELPADEGLQYHRVEGFYGQFSRSFAVPGMVDLAGVKAELKEGLLTIHLPKREEAKPRQIEVVPDLQAAIQRTGTKPALLLINRGGNSFFLTVRPR